MILVYKLQTNRDSGSWSPTLGGKSQVHSSSSSIVAPSNSPGVVLLSQKPIDTSLPPLHSADDSKLCRLILDREVGRGFEAWLLRSERLG